MISINFFNEFPQLETQNLILRETKLSDAEAVFKIFSDEKVTKYHDLETATSIEQAKWLINRRAERYRQKQAIRWGIAKKKNNIIIGSCGFSIKNSFLAELGYELASEHWQQGIMTEALQAILAWGFHQLDLNRIEAMVMQENIASLQLLKKLSFLEEGLLREYGFWKGKFHDLKIYSILKREYLAANLS